MKLAIFKRLDTSYSYETAKDESWENTDGFIRISEYVEVEFPPLNSGEVVEKQRQELRALTYMPARNELERESGRRAGE